MVECRIVNLGGVICIAVPANLFVSVLGQFRTLDREDKYTVTMGNGGVQVDFAPLRGGRTLQIFGLAASNSKSAIGMTSAYGVDIHEEASQLGWKPGDVLAVAVGVRNQVPSFFATK